MLYVWEDSCCGIFQFGVTSRVQYFVTILSVLLVLHLPLHSLTGSNWTIPLKHDMSVKIVENLQSITDTKAFYTETYFQQIALDLQTAARNLLDITSNTTTRPGWYDSGNPDLYLPSYSANYYDPFHGVAGSTNYSSYARRVSGDVL